MTLINNAPDMGMSVHETQPTANGRGDNTPGSSKLFTALQPQLPRPEELLADPETLRVLREYFPNFKKAGKVFATDHSKRVNIFLHQGLYLVKDFSGKEFGDDGVRNTLQVLQYYHRIGFPEAVALLAEKLGHTSTRQQASLRLTPISRPLLTTSIQEPEPIRVEAGQWGQVMRSHNSNFHRYARSLGVSREHLSRWNVGTDTWRNTVFGQQDQAGAYLNLKFISFQAYGDRYKKKPPFYLKNPEGGRYGQCLYGIHLLREGLPVVIVESEKTAVLASYFYPQFDFVATGGASSLSEGKVKALSGKQGYVLHDADATGRLLGTWQVLQKKGLDFIPVELFPEFVNGYDLADAIRDGLRPDITRWDYQLKPSPTGPDYRLFVGRYLGEQAKQLSDYIQRHGKVLLKARTGTGKTTFALEELAPRVKGRVIILEPLTVIVDAIAKSRYGEAAIIKQGATQEDVQVAVHNKITVCTYDSFLKIDQVTEEDLIICDEVHALLSGYSMPDKRAKYEHVFRCLREAENVLCISATPPDFLQAHGFKYVEVIAGHTHRIQLTPITYKGKIQHEIARLLPTLDFANYQYLIRLSHLKLIEQILIEFKGLAPEQVAVLSSDTKGQVGGVYQAITDTKYIPEGVRLVFTTSLIDCGVDLYNERLQVILAEHENEYLSVPSALQFMARARRIPSLEVMVYKKERQGREFDREQMHQALQNFARRECQSLNDLEEDYQKVAQYYPKGSSYAETGKFCKYNPSTQRYEVNELMIQFEVEQAALRSASSASFFRQLGQEGHVVVQEAQEVTVPKTPETEALDQAAKAGKQTMQEGALALLEAECATDLFTSLYHTTRDLELRKRITKFGYDTRLNEKAQRLQADHGPLLQDREALLVFKNYLSLKERHVDPGEIVPMMRAHQGSRKFGDLLVRLDILYKLKHYEQLSPADRRDAERIFAHKRLIREKVTELTSIDNRKANRVTADTITELINRDRHQAIKLSKDKAMRLFHILFETEVVVIKEKGRAVKYYGIVADNTESPN